jgi:DNA-binding GntR family transcriptional regulator
MEHATRVNRFHLIFHGRVCAWPALRYKSWMNRTTAPLDPSAARAPSLVTDAYRALKEAIRDNVFAPGDQGSEQEIALRLGMSRTPVHEALIRLQEEGLVRVVPKRGVIVLALSPDDMREVYDVIIALESMAAELIAAMAEPERHRIAAELHAINADMKTALQRDERDAWARADDQFHRALIDRCGNTRLARLANTIMDQSHRARMMTLRLRAKMTKSVKEHQAIVAAIRNGEAAVAGERAKAHRQRARNELLPLLDQFGMKHL